MSRVHNTPHELLRLNNEVNARIYFDSQSCIKVLHLKIYSKTIQNIYLAQDHVFITCTLNSRAQNPSCQMF